MVGRGSCRSRTLPFEVAVDGAVKGTLTAAGGFAGQSIGLLLFGPAGAVVFAAVGGTGALFGSDWARHQLDKVLVSKWILSLDGPAEHFRLSLKTAMRGKIGIILKKVDRLDVTDRELAAWLRLRMLDNAVAIAEGLAELEFDAVERKQPDRARELLRLMKDAGVHPWSVQPKLRALLRSLAAKPTAREAAHRLGRTNIRRLLEGLAGRSPPDAAADHNGSRRLISARAFRAAAASRKLPHHPLKPAAAPRPKAVAAVRHRMPHPGPRRCAVSPCPAGPAGSSRGNRRGMSRCTVSQTRSRSMPA